MPDYYADNALAAYTDQQANYETVHQLWADQTAAAQAAYETGHAAWVADPTLGTDPPIEQPEPQPPTAQPEPQPPSPPPSYSSREVEGAEEIETATGPVLVVGPRVVLAAPDGTEAALSDAELAAGYTLTTEAQL